MNNDDIRINWKLFTKTKHQNVFLHNFVCLVFSPIAITDKALLEAKKSPIQKLMISVDFCVW